MRKYTLLILFSILLGAGIIAVYALPRNGLTAYERWKEMHSGRVFLSGPRTQRSVALTFDDGPDPRYTPKVLDILNAEKVKATFFLCGNMLKRHPELGKRIVSEGHVVGNHSMTHAHMEHMAGPAGRHEIADCEQQIERLLGTRTHLFRPPRGLWNAGEFTDASKTGFQIVLWSLAFDRESVHDSRVLRKRTVRLAEPGDIVLMHDGSFGDKDIRSGTVRELKQLIIELKQRGFQFATVPELLGIPGDEPVTAGL